MSCKSILPINYQGEHCYNIQLTDSFDTLGEALEELQLLQKKICIVSDSNVDPLYGKETENLLLACGCPKVCRFIIPAGEENKTLEQIERLYEFLILHHFDRSDSLLALGGGVVGDMTGYTAATYLRGIRFVQVPTTLLSMVDSSIGGKTGVDFKGYKNMVGAFYQPSLVYVNTTVLRTLDKRQFASGMGEIIKHGLIQSSTYFQWLCVHKNEVRALLHEEISQMILMSQNIKKKIVETDPKEKGERAFLNFGHTIGHAIEKSLHFSLLHGECVALGCVAAAFISFLKGNLHLDDLHLIEETITSYGLPVRYSELDNTAILENCSHDKKKEGNSIRYVLLNAIGDCYISTDVTDTEADHAINYLKEGIY